MSTDYEERTVDELRDELRDRDLTVSGSKDELVERLREDDEADADEPDAEKPDAGGADADEERGGSDGAAAGTSMRDVLARIRQDLGEVAGLQVERTSGLSRDDKGWRARVEVVEVSRVPPSTDILGSYEVVADGDGSVLSFDRIERYRRSEASA